MTDGTTLSGVRVTLKINMDHTDIKKARTDKLYVTIDFQGILSATASDDIIKNVVPALKKKEFSFSNFWLFYGW